MSLHPMTEGNDRMETNYTKRVYEAKGNILDLTQELRGFANAFAATGNAYMAKNLSAIAIAIDNYADEITDAMSDDLTEQLRWQQEQMGKTLVACLDNAERLTPR